MNGDEEPGTEISSPSEIFNGDMQSCLAIGAFIYGFSQLEFTLKAILANHLKLADEHFDIVLGDTDFGRICTMLEATGALRFANDGNKLAKMQKLISRARALNNQRVIIAHGTWSPAKDGLVARKVNRQNLRAAQHLQTPEEIKSLAEQTEELMSACMADLG